MATVPPASHRGALRGLDASLEAPDTPVLRTDELENRPGIVVGHRGGREVQVIGTAEMSAAPDRARLYISVTSSKGSADEAKNSVQRRLDYIEQCLRQREISEENTTISKEFKKISSKYQMEAEVCVLFSDFDKLQSICNLLVEKLDSSVNISPPQFYHTPQCMEKLRREVCLGAVGNARRKAQEVCNLVGQSLGKALIIREEEMKEWEDQAYTCFTSPSLQQKIKSATIYAAANVFATFEIKLKERNKKN